MGAKTISVMIACVLWVVVLGSRKVEVAKEVPVEIVTSDNIVPGNDIPDRIVFRLSGPKAFLRTVLDRVEKPIRVNLMGAKPGLVTYRFFSDNIRIPIGVKVLSINPAAILVKLEKVKYRTVPIRLKLSGNPAEGYEVLKSHVKPKKVKIKGAASRIKKITELRPQAVDVSGIKASTKQDLKFDLAQLGVAIEGSVPQAYIKVRAVSANFKIRNVKIRVLSNYQSRLSDGTVTVFVRATEKDLESIDESKVFAEVNLSKQSKGKYRKMVSVTVPIGIGLVKVEPRKVNVTLF